MKTIKIILMIIAIGFLPIANAGDLVYKSGFEATALVSGTASGVTSSGLILKLSSGSFDEDLSINEDGSFVFFADIPFGDTWTVSTSQLPNTPQQQTCEVTNSSGVMPATGADLLTVTCNQTLWNWNEMNWDEGGWN